MKVLLTTLFSLFLLIAIAQTPDSLKVVKGPEKYNNEVVRIFEKYGKISDSLTQIGISQQFKSDTTQKNGYNAKVVGFYIDEELKEMKNILSRFLTIKRVTAVYIQTDAIKKENTYTVSFEGAGDTHGNGLVKWVIDFK